MERKTGGLPNGNSSLPSENNTLPGSNGTSTLGPGSKLATTGGSIARTGDAADPVLWIAVMIGAAALIVMLLMIRKNQEV